LELPEQFKAGHASAAKALLPAVNQSGSPGTELGSWSYGRAYFELGWPAQRAALIAQRDSGDAGQVAAFHDAISIGSFIGRILRGYSLNAEDSSDQHVVFSQATKEEVAAAGKLIDARLASIEASLKDLNKSLGRARGRNKRNTAAAIEGLTNAQQQLQGNKANLGSGVDAAARTANIRVPVDRRLFNVGAQSRPVYNADGSLQMAGGLPAMADERTFTVSLSVLESPGALIDALTAAALRSDVALTADLPGTTKLSALDVDIDELQRGMAEPGVMCTGMDNFHSWRSQFGRKLFIQLQLQVKGSTNFVRNAEEAAALWDRLSGDARRAWNNWLRAQRGMRLMEISLSGFFANGGAVAYLAMAIYPQGTQTGIQPAEYLEKWFNTVSDAALLVAPGLSYDWQGAILQYAGPTGRGDMFAIMDTPRYLLTQPTEPSVELGKHRWVMAASGINPYEGGVMGFLARPEVPELRHNPNDTEMDSSVPRDNSGHGAAYGPWFIAANPLATGPEDAFVIAPPSGFMAGAFAASDNRSGVQKVPANVVVQGVSDLLCTVTSVEQGPLNGKSINLIRHRPSGMTVWGGRTTSNDPVWRYINKRRVFSFCERSVRDAVQWAVFLPNNDTTRSDLRSTIDGFLYAQWQSGVLDGGSQDEAYSVQCDDGNNPLSLRKQGLLNVDVGIQPPYPAEFVVIRFREQA
jgi:hypothetical protein